MLLTLDAPYLGRRLNEFRNSFGVPKGMEYPNLFPGVDVTNLEEADESMAYGTSPNTLYTLFIADFVDSSIEWPELMPFFP